MAKNLVIVESPAKAHTIEKYLGRDFQVLASVGHIRKDTKVDKNTFDVTYEIDPDHKKIISELKKAAKTADTIWLATDEDREGEAISWHLLEVLNLPPDTKRITFHEITKPALEAAIQHPRTIDMDMVASQQARQTLDMLVGFDLSGVVRRKVPGAISAGRVQSPALRLIVEREQEIADFKNQFKFKVSGLFQTPTDAELSATLNHALPTSEAARQYLEQLLPSTFTVTDRQTTPGTRRPAPPLTTAALQIEANSRLGFSARTTMNAAQALYQAGHITYHRTDSLNLSSQALAATAHFIKSAFGEKYLKVRRFTTKSATAQEAHEAIRPTHIEVPEAGKNDYERKLYRLIRARTLATQMADAITEKTTIQITASTDSKHVFEAKGEVIIFDGFLKVTGRAKDEELPILQVGDQLTPIKITARQTFQKPPARYTEGSLVKKLEELGIGRPSTYASILSAIQARGYVQKGTSEGQSRPVIELTLADGRIKQGTTTEKTGADKGKLIPTPTGQLITGFLTQNFPNIVDYQFTANIEQDLDQIADHKLERVQMLRDFYGPFRQEVQKSDTAARYNNARELGTDPKTGLPIFAKIGKTGGFIQLGDNEKSTGEKPRFAPLPDGVDVNSVTLDQALAQLALPSLPRLLGPASDGTPLIAAAGPFGPYLKAGKYNLPIKDYDPYTIDLATAQSLYQAKLDSIIADFGDIMIINGAYGPYIKGPGRFNNVKIPKDRDPKSITKAEAEAMLAAKPARRGRAKASTKSKSKAKSKTAKTKSKSTKSKSSRAQKSTKSRAKSTKKPKK